MNLYQQMTPAHREEVQKEVAEVSFNRKINYAFIRA